MPITRRAVALLPAVALALAVANADAAQVGTLTCVPSAMGQSTMPIVGSGFTPNGSVALWATTPGSPTPVALASTQIDPGGGFSILALPPPFADPQRTVIQTYDLVAEDKTNPNAPVVAPPFAFTVVRFGLALSPNPERPHQRVKYTARGFVPGSRVYVHFRFAGRTRRTVSLGVANSPCGIVSRRMRALPTKIRYGTWQAYVDQSRRFSQKTRPQWIESFRIRRVVS